MSNGVTVIHMNKGAHMQIKNFRVAYSDYDVTSTLYQKKTAEELARQLEEVAPTLETAKCFVHLAQWNLKDHGHVDGLGDPLCTRLSGVENTEDLVGLFIHMKGEWHYSDDGIYWEPTRIEFPKAA